MRSKRVHNTLVIMMKLMAIGVFLTTLTGCFPYATSYVHLDAPGITHDGGCTGPPVFATFEAKGAQFAVTLEPRWTSRSSAGFLRVRASQELDVSIRDAIGYLTPNELAPIRFELRRVEPWEERFGRQILKRQGVLEHRFEFSALPPIAFSGTLQLPTIYLDGLAVDSPSFKFDRRSHAGIAPLNC